MPIVQTESTYFMNEPFKRVVRVLADGFFHIKLPDAVVKHFDQQEVSRDTLDKALRDWGEICGKFQKSQTTSRKVIIYEIQDDNHFAHGLQVAVAAQVFTEKRMVNPDEEISYHYDRVDSKEDLPWKLRDSGYLTPRAGDRKVDHILEWTQPRHDFFTSLAVAMGKLKEKLLVLGNDQDVLEAAINNRLNLLE